MPHMSRVNPDQTFASVLEVIQAKKGGQEERDTNIFYKGKCIKSDADLVIRDIVGNNHSASFTIRYTPLMLGGMLEEDIHALIESLRENNELKLMSLLKIASVERV